MQIKMLLLTHKNKKKYSIKTRWAYADYLEFPFKCARSCG